LGDRGAYQLTLSGDWLYDEHKPGEPFPFLTYERQAMQSIRDGAGRIRMADVVDVRSEGYSPYNVDWRDQELVQGDAWTPDNVTLWFKPASANLLISGQQQAARALQNLTNLPQPPQLGLQRTTDLHQDIFAYGSEDYPWTGCLLGESYPARIGANDTLQMMPCILPALSHYRYARDFKPAGNDTIRGIPTLKFTGTDQDGNVTVWFASGLPVPLRYEATQENTIAFNGTKGLGTFRLELVAFERGGKDLVAGPTPGPALGPLTKKPREPWGLNETGVASTFPASLAWQKAKQESPAVQKLIAKSPDAYVARADLLGWVEPNDRYRTWFMTATDGSTSVMFMVTETAGPPSPDGGQVGSILQQYAPQVPEPLMDVHYQVTDSGSWNATGYYPDPRHAPDQVPTLASLLQRRTSYSNLTAANGDDVMWGFDIVCNSECKDGLTYTSVGVEHLDRRTVAVTPGGAQPVRAFGMDYGYSYLGLDAAGRASWSMQSTQTTGSRAGPFVAAAPEKTASPIAALVAPSGPALTAVAAMTVSLAGLAAAVAYFLWPLAKAGTVGLFSRVKGDRLLDSPIRAELLQRIEAHPGIHHSDLVRAVGRGNGTVEHHLQKLTAGGVILRRKGPGYTCFFPARTDRRAMDAAPLLKSPIARGLVERVRRTPGLTSAQAARELGVTAATLHYHLERLGQAGLVQAPPQAATRSLRLTADGEAALA